ncbi:MAG: pentapeptide repeat-containing protein, partial [Nitrospirales bacterium]
MNDFPDQNGKEGESKSLSSENLAGILSAHQKWLDSEGKVGTRCNLSDTNLRYVDLSGKALRAAILDGTNLQFAQMKNAKLQDSSLANADLSEAKGLLEEQLA